MATKQTKEKFPAIKVGETGTYKGYKVKRIFHLTYEIVKLKWCDSKLGVTEKIDELTK